LPHQERLNIAVFIDFDNIEIGVRTTLNQQLDVGTVLDAIKERGEVVTKIAYADWTRASEYSRALTQHAIRLVQRNLTPGGDKNGADINLALDALEMAFTHPHINAYVIVGGDSDFLSLVEKLKQYDKKVFVVGGRAFTSVILQRNCHEFIAYENLAGVRKSSVKGGHTVAAAASSPIAQAFPIVRRALKILADREVSPQTGLLKSTLLQLDSTFSERNYGASSFLDFVEKLAHASLVQLKHAGRSVMVELNDGFREADGAAPRTAAATEEGAHETEPIAAAQAFKPAHDRPSPEAGLGGAPSATEVVQGTEPAADGVKLVGRILGAATTARWPMYLRNVKQLVRAADAGFDERRYGFTGLMDLLRACQRDGLVRLERDRRGGLRVFQGPALGAPGAAAPPGAPLHRSAGSPGPGDTPPSHSIEAVADEPVETREAIDDGPAANEPIPIDTTAELLGRAKAKRPRARAMTPGSRPSTGSGPRKAAARPTGSGQRKPPATRRVTRSQKASAAEAKGEAES
jgi:uncharacterized LabA/DUF88 family protein